MIRIYLKIFLALILFFLTNSANAREPVTEFEDFNKSRLDGCAFMLGQRYCSSLHMDWDSECQHALMNYKYGMNSNIIKNFYTKLVDAFQENDKESVAEMIEYPFEVNFRMDLPLGKVDVTTLKIENKEAFIANFNRIASPLLKHVLIEDRYNFLATYIDYLWLRYKDCGIKFKLICSKYTEDIKTCRNIKIRISNIYVHTPSKGEEYNPCAIQNPDQLECRPNIDYQNCMLNYSFASRAPAMKAAYFKLIKAIREDDKNSLAKMILYPFNYKHTIIPPCVGDDIEKKLTVNNVEDFINQYENFFDDEMKQFILNTRYEDVTIGLNQIKILKKLNSSESYAQYALTIYFKCNEGDELQTCRNYRIGISKVNKASLQTNSLK